MKRIIAIVRPEKMEAVKEALFKADVSGMTISQVNGCGNQHGWTEYFRGTEVLLNMVPKVKFEIVADCAQVNRIVDVICAAARTDSVGDGKIFISPVEEVVRIRTGERLRGDLGARAARLTCSSGAGRALAKSLDEHGLTSTDDHSFSCRFLFRNVCLSLS